MCWHFLKVRVIQSKKRSVCRRQWKELHSRKKCLDLENLVHLVDLLGLSTSTTTTTCSLLDDMKMPRVQSRWASGYISHVILSLAWIQCRRRHTSRLKNKSVAISPPSPRLYILCATRYLRKKIRNRRTHRFV